METTIIAKAIVDFLQKPIDERKKISRDTLVKAIASSKIKAPPRMPEAKHIAGETWSSKMMRENPGSRWITYRNNHLLIVPQKDNKSATVVFSANPAFEHLKLKPKTEKEYKEAEKEVSKQKRARGHRETDVTQEEVERSKLLNKQRKEIAKKIRENYLEKLYDAANISQEQREDITLKDIRKIEKKVDKMVDPIYEYNPMETMGLKEALEMIKNEGDLNVKKRATQQLQKKASEELVDETIREELGLELQKDEEVLKTGNPEIDKALKRVKLDREQALKIKSAQVSYKEEMKRLKTVFEDEVIVKTGNIRITDMQGIAKEFDKTPEKLDEAVEAAIQDVKNRQRANLNTQFYGYINKIGSSNNKHQSDGAANEVNAFAGMYLNGGYLTRDFMDFVGIENAARIVSSEILKRKDWKKIRQDLEEFMSNKASKLVVTTLNDLKDKWDRIESYRQQQVEGILAGRTSAINAARQYAMISKEIGEAAGSLQVSANILDLLRDDQKEIGDIVVDGGKNLANLRDLMYDFGLKEKDYFVKKKGSRYEVIIPYEKFGDLVERTNVSKERDLTVNAIKSGATKIEGFLPPGSSNEYWDTQTAAQLGANKEGWEKFKNTKGEPGYTSHQKEGTTLYRKKKNDFVFQPHQQRMYEFAEYGKRVVWNAGAGSGKTITMLGTIKGLKEKGKLKSFAVITPPSRLVNEFFKDQEKFYPDLKMVNLDEIRGFKNKKQVLQDAKEGKYDIVISGHDSIKIGGGKGALKVEVKRATDQFIDEKLGGRTPTTAQRKKIEEAMTKKLTGNIGLPAMIAEAGPGFVGIDEAHEAFKSVGKDTDRSGAIKTLSKNAEYFIPMTGTAVRNDVGELASLLSVTRPDIIDNANRWKRKWKNVGSQSTLMKNQTVNEFRREFDNIMITEHLELPTKLTESRNKIKITPEQKEAYKQSEKQYMLDKHSDGYYGIMDLKTRNLLMNGDQTDLVKYSPQQTGFEIYDKDTDSKGKQSKSIRTWLKANGYNPDEVHLKVLGGAGASARRDSRHDLNLHAGDYKTNAKVQQILKDYNRKQAEGNSKQLVFFNRNESLDTLKEAFKANGLQDNEITVLEGSMNGVTRKKQVNEFNTDPDVKVILSSKVGQTGLNMQSGNVIHWLSRNNTFAEQEQGNARAYRKGQKNDVDVFYNDSDTVVDNNRIDLIIKKKNLTEAIGDYDPKNNILA